MTNTLLFLHSEWISECHLNNNNISRKDKSEEIGKYTIFNDNIIIKWDKWTILDEFIKYHDYYYHINFYNKYFTNIKEYKFIHNEWETECILNTDLEIIFKKNNIFEIGSYKIDETILKINWDKWGQENFVKNKDKYYQENFLHNYITNSSMQETQEYQPSETDNTSAQIKEKIDDNIIPKKIEIFKKINNVYYLNKISINSSYTHYLDNICDLQENNNDKELFSTGLFTNLQNLIKNSNYLNTDNIKKYSNYLKFDKQDILDNFFSINLPFEIKKPDGKRRCLTLVEWGYPPFGGGENWMLTFNRILHKNNYENYLICFSDPFKNEYFTEIKLINLNYVKIIQMPKDILSIIKIIRIINPDFVNHQGINRMFFMKIANVLNIPFLTGFCFWNDIIHSGYSNVDMINNSELKKSDNFDTILQNSYTYVASQFVNDIIKKVDLNVPDLDIIETISTKEEFEVKNDILNRKYVSLINCHYNKGGHLIKYLCENLDINIPLQFIYTENDPNITKEYIKNLIDIRNSKKDINILVPQKIDIKKIYGNTKIILIPSLCDETFCRIGYEAMNNNIPIISSKSGNLKYLLKDYAIFVDPYNESLWKNNIEKIYFDKDKILNFSKNIISTHTDIIEDKILKKIDTMVSSKSKYVSNDKNIGLIIPWADQGLGIQGRDYYLTLKELGYNPFVLSFRPYHSTWENIYLQTNSKEWEYDNITYSSNYRENLTYDEIIDFVYKNNIKKIIIIEATFIHIFKIAAFLKTLNVSVYLVVNIECIRIDEINYHHLFDKILTNNKKSDLIVSSIFGNKTQYLGFHLNHHYFKNIIRSNTPNLRKLRFCCMGGLNSISRKNIDIIIKIFYNLDKTHNIDWILNVYVQGVEIPEIFKNIKCDKINYHVKGLSYLETLQKYMENDIFIHLGSHEGLGLGFYESLYCGTPILTTNWTPSNELITDNINGWLIDTDYGEILDNTVSLINKCIINEHKFKEKIIKIITERENTLKVLDYTFKNKELLYNKNKINFENVLKTVFSSI